MFCMVLSDSLLCGHKQLGVKLHGIKDGEVSFQTCMCIASGGALLMSGTPRRNYSAISLAMKSLNSEPVVRARLADDPTVRILVMNAEMSTAKCRKSGEQFPRTVHDRARSPLIKRLETAWSICDLEDVVMESTSRTPFPELEVCQLRHRRGIYGQPGDDLHFRSEIAIAAGDELVKACRRTAIQWYGDCFGDDAILLILAAGWNINGATYDTLDYDGHAWRRAELIALAELCALNGHRFSNIRAKMAELVSRSEGSHQYFLMRDVADIVPVLPQPVAERQSRSSRWRRCPGHLEGWILGPGHAETDDCDQRNDVPAHDNIQAGTGKRKRDADHLAEMMQIDVDTAEIILQNTGSLETALNHEMFQRPPEAAHAQEMLQRSRKRWNGSLKSSSVQRIEIDDESDDGCARAPAASSTSAPETGAEEVHVQRLMEMGFVKAIAEVALQNAGKDFSRAVELLLRNSFE